MPICKICDGVHNAKKTWDYYNMMCRSCLYLVEMFSLNGNYLSEY